MKPILPSLRERNRYIVFEVISRNKIRRDDVKKEISNICRKMLGEYEMARAGLLFLEDFDNKNNNNKCIIKVNHKYSDKIRSCFLFIKSINGHDVIVQTKGISGILKKARNKFFYN